MNDELNGHSSCFWPLVLILVLIGTAPVQARPDKPREAKQNRPARETPVDSRWVSRSPLTKRSGSDDTLFERRTAEETGLDMTNPLTFDHPRWDLFIRSFAGGGVAVGDYDGDDRPDVFFSGQIEDSRLYKQTGSLTFKDVTEEAGLNTGNSWSAGASFADVNGDGWLDLYICQYMRPNDLYINEGDGTFQERASAYDLDLERASVMGYFSDYDRDGDLDLYLVTYRRSRAPGEEAKTVNVTGKGEDLHVHSSAREFYRIYHPPGRDRPVAKKAGQRDHLLRNDDGTFRDVTEQAGLDGFHHGNAALWWDYNRDGWPDLYVANDFYGPDRLYRNNGDGTFTNVIRSVVPHTPWTSMGVAAGDLTGNGWSDLVATDMAGRTHRIRKQSAGLMSQSSWFLRSSRPPQYARNAVLLNHRFEPFQEAAFLTGMARTNWTWATRIADLNNDRRQDVYFTTGMTRDFVNIDLQRRQEQLSSHYQKRYSKENPRYFRAWDQHRQKLFRTAPPREEKNMVFENEGNLAFINRSASWGLDRRGISFGAALSDLDRDGDLDILVNNVGDPVSLYENRNVSGHRLLIRLRGRESNNFGLGSQLTVVTGSDRLQRYVRSGEGFMSADAPVVHVGLGEHETIEKLIVRWPSGIRQVIKEPPPDHLYTIKEPERPKQRNQVSPSKRRETASELLFRTSELDGFTHQESEFHDMTHQPLLPWKHSRLGPGLAWGDVNGDSSPDLFVGGAAGQAGRLFVNRNGTLTPRTSRGPWAEDADHEDMGVLLIDVEGDGDRDLFVASGSSEHEPDSTALADRIYLNEGDGTFSNAPDDMLPEARVYSGPAAAVDFDRDGDLDLFVGGRMVPRRYPDTPRSRLLENRDGSFVDVTEKMAPGLKRAGMVTGALWTDVNGDGWNDLLITTAWGPIRYFRNKEGRLIDRTKEAGIGEMNGLWNGITGADVNRDGHMDYIVTNMGENTRYHASQKRPYLLFADDFDGDTDRELVEALYENDTRYPVDGRREMARSLSYVRSKFKTYRSYARVSLSGIISETALGSARRLMVTDLRNMFLLNRGDGTFAVRPLPARVQIAPGFSAVASSFDGRPGPDLLIAQNFFSTRLKTGRMDGGIGLLLRSGSGAHLQTVAPGESGVSITGDMMAVARSDVNGDGRPDVVMSRNNQSPVLLIRRGQEEAPLAFRFVNNAGKPVVGTRVTFREDDETIGVREIRAGGGYLSQSTNTMFVHPKRERESITVRIRWPDGSTQRRTVDDIDNKERVLRMTKR